ncbi:TetR/AcrR family transcriptional regulator [Staphylococcus sp. GDX8P80P]|uniref:TetR/AcrR family transcriptional regulator n=1 Tax=Staphylococcus sp. GDX8P80P TaxID=2804104 RepID=UPI001AEC4655|nr:TetR/AcrR family transcriptional regulator [Staphylococcus sp. GDX8P80P]
MEKHRNQAQAKIDKVFLELLEDQGFYHIKVSEIVRKSQINRSTFYDYYLDKYDLLEQLQDRLLDDIKEHSLKVRGIVFQRGFQEETMKNYLLEILNYIEKKRRKFSLFLAPELRSGFQQKFKETFEQIWYQNQIIQIDENSKNYLSSGTSALLVELLTIWVTKANSEPKENFAKTLMKFLSAMFITFKEDIVVPNHRHQSHKF